MWKFRLEKFLLNIKAKFVANKNDFSTAFLDVKKFKYCALPVLECENEEKKSKK